MSLKYREHSGRLLKSWNFNMALKEGGCLYARGNDKLTTDGGCCPTTRAALTMFYGELIAPTFISQCIHACSHRHVGFEYS